MINIATIVGLIFIFIVVILIIITYYLHLKNEKYPQKFETEGVFSLSMTISNLQEKIESSKLKMENNIELLQEIISELKEITQKLQSNELSGSLKK